MGNGAHRNKPLPFSAIEIGQTAGFEMTVTEEMHNTFSGLVGDYSPVHTQKEFCSRTRFGERIGYAFLLTGLLSRLYGEYLPGGSSVCIKQEAQFRKPFFVGDTISVTGTVEKKISSTRFVVIKSEMFRNGKECIFQGLGTVQILFEKS